MHIRPENSMDWKQQSQTSWHKIIADIDNLNGRDEAETFGPHELKLINNYTQNTTQQENGSNQKHYKRTIAW